MTFDSIKGALGDLGAFSTQADTEITLAEASAICGLAPVSLRSAAERGALKARLLGRLWYTTETDLKTYLANRPARWVASRFPNWRRVA